MQRQAVSFIKWLTLGTIALLWSWVTASQPTITQEISLTGKLRVIHGDDFDRGIVKVEYWLQDDQGQAYRLLLDEKLAKPFGGLDALANKRVKIVIEQMIMPPGPVRVLTIHLESPDTTTPQPAFVTGSQPWVTILCRFADYSNTPHPVSWFETLMGNSYPGMDHYWRQVSYNNIDLMGSIVVGWYNLPRPRSYYVYDMNQPPDGKDDLNKERAVNDCTAVADADVYFPIFSGINLMFNQPLDGAAYGNAEWSLTRDGQIKNYRITWLPWYWRNYTETTYDNQKLVAHEMGHALGLSHSSSPYNDNWDWPYDSQWDVMSRGGTCSSPDSQYGCIGVHTISPYKDFLGWIPSSRKFVPAPGSNINIPIERLTLPVGFSGAYLMAQIPICGSTTHFYTVESRVPTGYDTQIPSEAVIIHEVFSSPTSVRAWVVDSNNDNNNNVNDASAQWTIGETFTDPAAGIQISVNSWVPGQLFSVNINITSVTGQPNDNFVNAQMISGNSGSIFGSNVCATKEPGEPNHAGNPGGASVWYRWTAPRSGIVTIDTIGSNFDTLLAVYIGSAVNNLTLIASDDDSGGNLTSRVTFTAVSGTTYRIAVDGYNGAAGNIRLSWSLTVPTPALMRIERATGNAYTDGSWISGGADIAERIDVSEPVESGDVVELDPHSHRHYRKARGPYSPLIAGVISTAPGIIIGNQRWADLDLNDHDERPLLALIGRVQVKVTTENGPIRPGDLLTSSSRPGYAMRCNDLKQCEGAIIGKALEPLAEGAGTIMMLVMR